MRNSAPLILLLATFCTVLAAGCDPLDNHSSPINGVGIVGGVTVPPGEYQGVVAILDGNWCFCSGTLIDPEIVLTAAHCMDNYLPAQVTIAGGTYALGSNAEFTSAAQEIVVHEDWTGEIAEAESVDLALVHLSAPLDVPHYPMREEPYPDIGDPGKIVGYGITSYDAWSTGYKRMGNVTIQLQDDNFISFGGESGTCSGDSGGPLFTTQSEIEVLTGVASFISNVVGEECSPDYGSYNTNVLTHRGWIDENVIELIGHAPGEEPEDDSEIDAGDDTGTDDTLEDGGADETSSNSGSSGSCSFALMRKSGLLSQLTAVLF